MGNLLIVDDEPDILSSLEEMFRYESDLEIDIYTAKSAGAAVKLMEQIKFDVVMTDIKMPGMSGIQLYKLIKESWPKCRVIFLTGFRDFDDLYEISSYQDVRYLQKSEENEVLIAEVAAAFQAIEQMMLEEQVESVHQAEIRRAEIILRHSIMREYFADQDRIRLTEDKMRQIGLAVCPENNLFLFLMKADGLETDLDYEEEISREKLLCGIIEEFLPPRFEYYVYSDSNGYMLLFLQPVRFQEDILSARNWKRLYKNLVGSLEYIQEKALRMAGISISFVTCDERCFLKDAPVYLNRLKQEALRKIQNGMQMIVEAESYAQEQGALEHSSIPDNLQIAVKQLEHVLSQKEYGEFVKRIYDLTGILIRLEKKQPDQAKELYYSIAVVLTRSINVNHIKNKIERYILLDRLLHIESYASMKEAAEYLRCIANRIAEEMNLQGSSRTNLVLDKVVQYIEGHLSEDLTLNRLAEIGYINGAYLSRIFKQKYGCNLNAYIVNARLERARTLLCTTSMKVNEIAAKAGYLSAASFTRVFKKTYGMSPVDYRDRYGEKGNEI